MIRALLRWLLTSPAKPAPLTRPPVPPYQDYDAQERARRPRGDDEFDGYNEIGAMG